VCGFPPGNVLFSIIQDSKGLSHLARICPPPALGLSGAYFKIAEKAIPKNLTFIGSTPEENVAELMAAAVEADSSQAARFLNLLEELAEWITPVGFGPERVPEFGSERGKRRTTG
jgi:hypothetical protein